MAEHEQAHVQEGGDPAESPKESKIQIQSTSPSPPARGALSSPRSLMRRFEREMDRIFDEFFGSALFRWPDWAGRLRWPRALEDTLWPEIEVRHAANKLVVQADVPGLTKDDVSVEIRDRELCISGERREEAERTEEGRYHRKERSYGRFCRTIPLPERAKPETATATFGKGVLRVEVEAPGGAQAARRIEIREGSSH